MVQWGGKVSAIAACSTCAVALLLGWRCRVLGVALRRSHELRQAERQGRTEAEKRLRQLRTSFRGKDDGSVQGGAAQPGPSASEADDVFSSMPIGYMRTCFSRRSGTPRQPHLVPAAKGVLELKAKLPRDILSGLEDYSHCWIIYVFHENTNLGAEWGGKMKGKVQVPRLDGGKVGVLATRSPHRPNAIGLSSAKIESVSDKVLVVSGLDLVDGSPVLDVKPYIPFCDVINSATTPAWVGKDRAADLEPLHISKVVFTERARAKLRYCWENLAKSGHKAHKLRDLYKDYEDLVQLVDQVLGRDIRSVYQRTSEHKTGRDHVYHLHLLENVEVEYVHDKSEVEVIDVHLRISGKNSLAH